MKRVLYLFLVLVLVLGPMLFVSLGCGSAASSGGGGGAAAPVVHTILSTPDAYTTTIGLAVKGANVLVAFVTGSVGSGNAALNLYRSTNTAETFSFVTREANETNTSVKADITNNNILCVGHRTWSGGTHYITISTMDAVSGTTFKNIRVAGGASVIAGSLDVCRDGSNVFVPFSDSGNVNINNLSANYGSSSLISAVNDTINDGGLAGAVATSNTQEVIFVDFFATPGSSEIIFGRSDDSGASFATLTQVASSASYENKDISMVGSDQYTDICYYRNGKIYSKSTQNFGQTWGPEVLVSDASDDMTGIAYSTTAIYIVFVKNGYDNICIAKSTDGTTWTVRTLVTLVGNSNLVYPTIKAEDNTIVIAYRTSDGVFLLKSTDDGATWN